MNIPTYSKMLTPLVMATALSGLATSSFAAPLPNGTILGFDTGVVTSSAAPCAVGTCFGMEVAPSFWIWTAIEAGFDGGLKVGAAQASGGQELAPSETNTASGDITTAWFFFGSYGTFTTMPGGETNIYGDVSCTGAACVGVTELNALSAAWSGTLIPISGGSVDTYTLTPDGIGNMNYMLDYANQVPLDCACGFEGTNFRGIARGTIVGVIVDPGPPIANDVSVAGISGDLITWTPSVSDPDGGALTCSIGANAANGNATVAADCSAGTYQSGAGYVGIDTFTYTTANAIDTSAPATVSVMLEPPVVANPCVGIPVSSVTTEGGGQSKTVNQEVQTTFIGTFVTTNGLLTGGKNSLKICPDTTVDYNSVGGNCEVNNAAAANMGTLSIGDKLICTNKPSGADTDRFSVKNGLL